jgi:hypothetical protein
MLYRRPANNFLEKTFLGKILQFPVRHAFISSEGALACSAEGVRVLIENLEFY